MSKSYSPINANTDSFEAWVNKTNDLLIDMSNVIVTSNADGSSGITNGSVTINNTLSANTGAFTTIRGGNTSTSNTLTVTSDVTFANEVNFKGGANYLKIWDNNSTNYYTLVTGNITSNYEINMAAGDVTLQPGTLVPTTGLGATGNWNINANTASAWATARTISLNGDASGSVTINGSSNATLSVTVVDDSHNHIISNVDGLQTELDGIQTSLGTKAPLASPTFTGTPTITGTTPSLYFDETDNAAYPWTIRSSGGNFQFLNSSVTANVVLFITQTGELTADGNITAFSDARLKENVVTIDSALDKVSQMRGVYYNRIDDETKTRNVGVIAQEIEKLLPEVVHNNTDDIKSVAYGNIIAVLIEAIKELNEEVKALRSKV
jgi:hypothetical protein